MILISNIVLEDLDGSTIASTEIYGADKKTYVNIGSGNVFNLKWTTTLTGEDTINYYNLVIKRYDPTLNVYYDILDKNIGLVNKFSINSDVLPAAPEQYLLHIYVVARGKTGSVVTSNIVTPYVCKGSGTYVKTGAGYMKRALSFVNAPTTDVTVARILDADGNEVSIPGSNENPRATMLLSSDTWNIVQEGFVKGTDGSWHKNDIKYEILLDMFGGIITDSSNESIFVL